MIGVSKSCLGGQAATTYVLPHNYQSTFVNSNTFYQLALVLWGVALEIRVLSERGLKKPSGWGCCEKLCVTSQLSNNVGKINTYLSTLSRCHTIVLCIRGVTWIRDVIEHWVNRGDLERTMGVKKGGGSATTQFMHPAIFISLSLYIYKYIYAYIYTASPLRLPGPISFDFMDSSIGLSKRYSKL